MKIKHWLAAWIVGIAVVLTGCGSAGSETRNAPSSATGAETPTVHMNTTSFIPSSMAVKTGQSLTLIADTFAPHIIANGTWANGTAQRTREQGAPEVADLKIDGNASGTVGPFSTPGTFQLYCTIHPNMNLTVVVE